MKKLVFSVIIILAALVVGFIAERAVSRPTVSFFPLDAESRISEADTKINLLDGKGDDAYTIEWTINSKSDKTMYLRQDVSLLFENGRLRGVRSKWAQNTDLISIREKLPSEDSSYFQSISYHHGENHYPGDVIKSVQRMTYDDLYVIDSPTTPLTAFTTPENEYQAEWKELLDRSSKQQLLFHWHQLLHHFQIDSGDYMMLSLLDLQKYSDKPLTGFSQEQTDNIVGRLWEGIYKNYVIPVSDSENGKLDSYVPLILIDKEKETLLVLFELNGKKERLIQKIPE